MLNKSAILFSKNNDVLSNVDDSWHVRQIDRSNWTGGYTDLIYCDSDNVHAPYLWLPPNLKLHLATNWIHDFVYGLSKISSYWQNIAVVRGHKRYLKFRNSSYLFLATVTDKILKTKTSS